jgi:hypothetical protein
MGLSEHSGTTITGVIIGARRPRPRRDQERRGNRLDVTSSMTRADHRSSKATAGSETLGVEKINAGTPEQPTPAAFSGPPTSARPSDTRDRPLGRTDTHYSPRGRSYRYGYQYGLAPMT